MKTCTYCSKSHDKTRADLVDLSTFLPMHVSFPCSNVPVYIKTASRLGEFQGITIQCCCCGFLFFSAMSLSLLHYLLLLFVLLLYSFYCRKCFSTFLSLDFYLTGFCGEQGCGDNGRCHTNDTCVCRKGYFGYFCEKTCMYIMTYNIAYIKRSLTSDCQRMIIEIQCQKKNSVPKNTA